MSISVGIDIGAHMVKVAVLRVAYRKTTLEALGCASVAEAGGVVEAIRAASAEALAGKPADGIAVAIEGVRSVVHTLSLPAGAQKELDDVLPFELEAALPVEMSESVFDYRVRTGRPAGFDTAEAASQISILAMVARTEDVRARIQLVKGALGQEPERVGAGALTLANLIPTTPALSEEGPVVVLDIGARSSEILIVADGEPAFARAVSWGAEGISAATAQKLAREVRVTIGAYRATGGRARRGSSSAEVGASSSAGRRRSSPRTWGSPWKSSLRPRSSSVPFLPSASRSCRSTPRLSGWRSV